MTKKKKSKVDKKILKKEYDKDLGINIANNAEAKRRKVAENNIKKIKKLKTPKTKHKVDDHKNTKTMSYNKYKVKEYISKIAIMISVIVVIVGVVIFINNRHILGITLKTDVDKKDSVLIELATGNNELFAYEDEILVYSNGIIKTYSKYGKKTWEYKFEEMFSPSIVISGKYLQITNKDSGYIYVFENKYEVARIKIDGEVKEANINKNGDTAVLYSSPGVKAAIGIYNKKGKESCKVKPDNVNIANFRISEDSRYLVYTEVIMQGISISENINIVDTTKANTIKNIKTVSSEMVNRLDIKGNNVDIMTDIGVYRYNINSNFMIEEKLTNKNITYLDYENKRLSIISKKIDNDAKSQLITKTIGSKEEKVVDIEDVPKDLKYTFNLSFVLFQKHIEVYNNFGKKVKGYKSDNIIANVEVFNGGKSIAVSYSNKIEIINL